MKRFRYMSATVLLALFVLVPAVAATTPQWEYMVISLGTPSYSSLESKTMAYWEDLISVDIMSVPEWEEDLDILGQKGWEVVSLLGSIGGDQEILLKRPYDAKRTSQEIQIAKDNQKLLVQGLLDTLENQDKSDKEELIDLDEKEYREAWEKKHDEWEKQVNTWINTQNLPSVTVRYIWGYTDTGSITFILDVTDSCLKGNTYRLSEVEAIANQLNEVMITLGKNTKFGFKTNMMYVKAFITFNDEDVVVLDKTYYYSSYSGLKEM